MVINRVYVHLVAGLGAKQREEFDAELHAPLGGWDAAERRALARLDDLADGDDATNR